MTYHPSIVRKDPVSLALDTANAAVRIASKQLTGNAGTVEIPNADGTSTIMGVGAGETGVAQWVGDTTAPGKPLGITSTSGNGMIIVTWDGTLDGGIPADFARTAILIDGVEVDSMTVAGSRAFGVYESGSVHKVSAIAYDDAHLEDGSSAPNASVASDPISVTVRSSDIDTSKLGIAITKTTVAASASKPGVNRGDLWNQYDKDPNIAGAVLIASWWWDSKQWVALPVAMYLDQLAARDIQANSAVIGLLAAGIITSGLFQTAASGARVVMDSNGIKAYDANGNVTFQVDSATGKATMVGGMATGVSGQNRAVVEYSNRSQQGQFKIIGSDDAPIFFIDGGQSSTSRYADLMVTNPKGVNPAISMSNTGAVSGETSIELNADEVSLNKHDLTSRKRCVCNWENSWSGVSSTGSGYLEGTLKFSMSRGWYLVEAYVRINGTGKEYHLDMLAKRTDGTLMDTWAMNFPMPSRGIGNMICSQMVYVDDDSVDLAAQLYSRDYGSRPELFVDNDGKWSLDYPKRALSRYFRIFAM